MSEVLWLNKETLEERWLHPYFCFYSQGTWVKVPVGATFATGDKDNFVFRKDGWYYEQGEWVKGDVNLQNLHTYKFVKLFWVKSNVKDNVFTLKRLLGCEVVFLGEFYYIRDMCCTHEVGHFVLENDTRRVYKSLFEDLTFFTEDGVGLTFDEYVQLYYGDGCVQS